MTIRTRRALALPTWTEGMTRTTPRRRLWPWIVLAVLVVILVPLAVIVVPILTHESAGQSNQQETDEQ